MVKTDSKLAGIRTIQKKEGLKYKNVIGSSVQPYRKLYPSDSLHAPTRDRPLVKDFILLPVSSIRRLKPYHND